MPDPTRRQMANRIHSESHHGALVSVIETVHEWLRGKPEHRTSRAFLIQLSKIMLQDCERTIQISQTAFQASRFSIYRPPQPRERDIGVAASVRCRDLIPRWPIDGAPPGRSKDDGLSSSFGSGRSLCLNWFSGAFAVIGMFLTRHWEGFGVSGSGKRVAGTVSRVAWNAIAVAHFRFRFRKWHCRTSCGRFKVR